MKEHVAIGMKQPDGTIRAIRLSENGYIGHAGAILGGWYKMSEQVAALLQLGDLRDLRETTDECVAYLSPHSPARIYADKEDFQRRGKEDADYLYLYEDGEWSAFGLYRMVEWIGINVEVGKENKQDAR